MFCTARNDVSPWRSQRSAALATQGMVCTSQSLASSAALDLLRRGGNAIDAAVCAAAVLGVVEPFSTGIGGDCFALVWSADEGELVGINGSGRAPAGLSLAALENRGLAAMPAHGMLPVTVPGAVRAWDDLLQRFGRLSLATVLEPAITYAREGFPVSEIIAYQWDLIVRFGVLQNDDARGTFAPEGRAPRLGEIMRLPGLARSLATIAAGGADVFYRGEIADALVACSNEHGGVLARQDLEQHTSSWVTPIHTDYRGHRVCEIPPNGQGIAALIGLNVLENFDLSQHELGSPENLHRRIEATKLALADRNRYVADPACADIPVDALLDKAYGRRRAAAIDLARAHANAEAGSLSPGTDTVYLTTADGDGNVVSFINSLFMPFGSGVVAGDTGIALQNRGYGFVAEAGHANCVAPGKRPLHTIIPGMVLRDGKPLVSFGVMGGHIQAQAHIQVISNLVDYGLNIQEALDCPRYYCFGGATVAIENEVPQASREHLQAMGHDVQGPDYATLQGGFGGGQGIIIDPNNSVLWGGSDRRKDGCALGY